MSQRGNVIKRIAAIVGGILGLFIVLVLVMGLIFAVATGAFSRAGGVVLSNPEQAVIDARQLIRDYRLTRPDSSGGQFIAVANLPESLHFKKLRGGFVFTNHLSLQMGRSPDWSVGARIWSEDSTVVHGDQPTRYSNVFFFSYCSDSPLTPDNQP